MNEFDQEFFIAMIASFGGLVCDCGNPTFSKDLEGHPPTRIICAECYYIQDKDYPPEEAKRIQQFMVDVRQVWDGQKFHAIFRQPTEDIIIDEEDVALVKADIRRQKEEAIRAEEARKRQERFETFKNSFWSGSFGPTRKL